MKRDGPPDSRWTGFWAQLRRDVSEAWREGPGSWREEREQWRETIAEIRQARQLDRRMKQRIAGLPKPTRRQFRHKARQIDAELDELKAIERRVLREHREGDDHG